MSNTTLHKSRIIIQILGIIAVTLVIITLLWKVPVYLKLKSINIPDGCEDITTQVIFSDVYWYHIIGNRVVKYDGGSAAVREYVLQNNSEKKLKNISVHPFFVETDDYAVSPYDYEVEHSDRDKYVIIEYYYRLE